MSFLHSAIDVFGTGTWKVTSVAYFFKGIQYQQNIAPKPFRQVQKTVLPDKNCCLKCQGTIFLLCILTYLVSLLVSRVWLLQKYSIQNKICVYGLLYLFWHAYIIISFSMHVIHFLIFLRVTYRHWVVIRKECWKRYQQRKPQRDTTKHQHWPHAQLL